MRIVRLAGPCAVGAALLASAPAAGAATVANPGPISASFTGGSISLAGGVAQMTFSPASPLSVSGTVDENGAVTIPASGVTIPPITGSSTDLGFPIDYTATLTPHDATGSVDPASGAGTVTLRAHGTLVVTSALAGATCDLAAPATPVEIPLTTGASAPLQGVPYNQADGTVTLVNGNFTLTRTCSFTGIGAAALSAALDLVPTSNQLTAAGAVSPVLTAPGFGQQTGGGGSTTTTTTTPTETVTTTTPQQTAGGGGTNTGAGGPNGCNVPKLKGLKLAKAKEALSKANCRLGTVRKKNSKKKKGTVIAQSPKAGSALIPRAKVALTISKGPKKTRKKR